LAGAILQAVGSDIPINLTGAKSDNLVLFGQSLFSSRSVTNAHLITIRLVFSTIVAAQMFCALEMVRGRFGKRASMAVGLVLIASPVLLSNAAIVTTDAIPSMFVALAFLALLRTHGIQEFPVLPWVFLGLAVMTKSNLLFFVPVLLLAQLVSLSLTRLPAPRGRLRAHVMRQLLLAMMILLLLIWLPYLVISPSNQFRLDLEKLSNLRAFLIEGNIFLPYEFRMGLGLGLERQARPAYIYGERYVGGKWSYFGVALSIKQAAMAIGLESAAVMSALLRRNAPILLSLVFPAVSWIIALSVSSINIGVRHALPAILLLVIAAGIFLAHFSLKFPKIAVCCAGIMMLEVACAFPNMMSYSNVAFGGVERTHEWLSDANVDLGQDLRKALEQIDERVGPTVIYGFNHGVLPGGTDYVGVSHREAFERVCEGKHPVFVGESQFGAYLPLELSRSDVRDPDFRVGGSIAVWLPRASDVKGC
jgi:4-amino-4-deoxy-L-arabinose transferase-like glycosyltransferase